MISTLALIATPTGCTFAGIIIRFDCAGPAIGARRIHARV